LAGQRSFTVAIVCLLIFAVASIVSRPKSASGATLPLLGGAHVPPAVMGIVDRACRDCHSEATRYPWYSYIAPTSFLIGHDVNEGREHLNLSRWDKLSSVRRQRALSEIANQVNDREMPLPIYTVLHPGAKLSKSDIDTLFEWTQTEKVRLITESAGTIQAP